jgi:pantoate--beta-alanine ligase
MNIVRTIEDWRALRAGLTDSIGFVPTMGALHEGHGSLLARSVAENEHTVLSIYVNPTQFNNPEDLDSYPDTLDADLAMAAGLGVDTVLLPTFDALYADDYRYQVREQREANALCGTHRPGHFDGVLTVVMKLLNLVAPDRAYFGEKDYQQYELVRDMCAAFFMPVTIVPCRTVRESDGLALSSRNLRLTSVDRALAPSFPRALRRAASDREVIAELIDLGFVVDYVETRGDRRYGAASLGEGPNEVRLIDNVAVACIQPRNRPEPATPELAEAS